MKQRLVFTPVAGNCIAVQDERAFGVVPADDFFDYLSITMIDHAPSWLSSVIRSTFYLHVHYRIAPKAPSNTGRDRCTRLAILGPYKEREALYQRNLLVKDLSVNLATSEPDRSNLKFGVVVSSVAALFASLALISSLCASRENGFNTSAQARKMDFYLQSLAEERRESRDIRDDLNKKYQANELASANYRSVDANTQEIPEHRKSPREIDASLAAKNARSEPGNLNLDSDKSASGIESPVVQNVAKSGSSGGGSNIAEAKAYSTKDMQSFGVVDPISMNNLSAASASIGIEVKSSRPNSSSAKKFYVFSKPGCSDCATVDSVLPEVSRLFLPVIFPAGFSEDPLALRGISASLCSSTPDLLWMAFSIGAPIPQDLASCDWLNRAKASEVLSILTDIQNDETKWPVIVAPNGAIHLGPVLAGNKAQAISEWLFANSSYWKKD